MQCQIFKPISSQLYSTMAALITSLFAGSVLLSSSVNAQDFGGNGRAEDAFSYVQPVRIGPCMNRL
jgi:hypothetical protein